MIICILIPDFSQEKSVISYLLKHLKLSECDYLRGY
nr:MAG TPA: hypothetical protein [Bacteriophage sp.]